MILALSAEVPFMVDQLKPVKLHANPRPRFFKQYTYLQPTRHLHFQVCKVVPIWNLIFPESIPEEMEERFSTDGATDTESFIFVFQIKFWLVYISNTWQFSIVGVGHILETVRSSERFPGTSCWHLEHCEHCNVSWWAVQDEQHTKKSKPTD